MSRKRDSTKRGIKPSIKVFISIGWVLWWSFSGVKNAFSLNHVSALKLFGHCLWVKFENSYVQRLLTCTFLVRPTGVTIFSFVVGSGNICTLGPTSEISWPPSPPYKYLLDLDLTIPLPICVDVKFGYPFWLFCFSCTVHRIATLPYLESDKAAYN